MRRHLFCLFAVAFLLLQPAFFKFSEAVAQSTASPISQTKLQQLIKLLLTNKDIQPLDAKFAVALGLTTPFTRKNALYDDGERHGFSVGVSSPDRLILYVRTKDGTIRIYAATLEAKLVSAATRSPDGVITPVSVEAAQVGFDAELRVWDKAEMPK